MARVYLGLGSNIERERYITAGLDALADRFGELALSPVYDCPAVGFAGQPFLNLVVGIDTDLGVGALARELRHVEIEHGRAAQAPRYSPRQLDIDILTYDDLSGLVEGVTLPRGELVENAFVLRPMADLAPEALHPLLGQSYRQLWSEFDGPREVRRVDFYWRGRPVSAAE
ncbi:2-amino-4-hydroxy-6-hydroxymethyldihydropteridine diphosphokinase [Haliea sp. E17]|uniref:2-amino-4-hydroxy-6- hydroxymethyldihydropteridine diphosphokinase n=1 Tax=Haliea sp. E17 TaxID=3401576 RepID=UPI003AAFE800